MKAEKLFLSLQILFAAIALIGLILFIGKATNNAGYATVSMIWSLIFGGIRRDLKNKTQKQP